MEAIKLQLANGTLLKHSAPQWKRVPLGHVALRGTDPETQPSPYVRAIWAGKRVGAVRTISVQAAYNRQNLFFRLEWPNATHNPDYGDGLVFPDAAAVLFSGDGDPPLARMGSPAAGIDAWYWRANREEGESLIFHGFAMLLKNLWPKLSKIVTIDWRMSTTAMHSDIVLPCATHTEKINFHYATVHTLQLIFNDRGAAPQGEALPEWHIFRRLCQKVQERAIAKGLTEYVDSRGIPCRLDNLYDQFTMGGEFEDDEAVVEEWVRDSAIAGVLPEGTTLATMREKGVIRFTSIGRSGAMLGQACDLKEDEAFCPLRWHVEKHLPYPTLTQRAQFYIDHEWFLEADEQLPRHKENPKMGGDYPLVLSTGHNRSSIHAANIINRMMQETNQGRPFMFMNINDAAERGISEGDFVRCHNDMGEFKIWVKLTPAVRPGQVIVYNGFEPFQFPDWQDPSWIEPGMVKWLHLAGGYGHFRFRPLMWQPVPVDRAVRLDVELVEPAPEGAR